MAYSASADVQNAVGGSAKLAALSDYVNGSVIDAAIVTAAIAEADALIDTYASKRFLVPFAPAPIAIAKLSAKIAARVLRRNRGMTLLADVEDEKTDTKWLIALAAGDVLPGVEPLPAKGSIVTDKAEPRDSSKAVSREKTKGFW